ncbi:IclR family transcriptional regulator [Sphaerisporangium sp. NPDC088356]|uniref:IclR family transcriptional regulator n=1 Tax=Sphaerisporangium sp. NPDC088356 TaxID=3154871 RepID=UPI0034425263
MSGTPRKSTSARPESPRAAAAAREGYQVPAVERTMLLLRALQRRGAMSLVELIEQTGLNKSTCWSLLRTLDRERLVEHDPDTRTYRLGIGLVELGATASEQLTYLGVIKRYLAELLEEMNVTFVIYRRLDQERVSLVDKLERLHRVRITVPVGTEIPIQGGSFGRCFLAYDPPEVLDAVLAGGLQAFTPNSVTDVDLFRGELAQVRERGWTVDHEGFALGISTIAAPVFTVSGELLLVVGGVGITSLLDDDTVEQWGARLRQTCDRIALSLATSSPPWGGRPAGRRAVAGPQPGSSVTAREKAAATREKEKDK